MTITEAIENMFAISKTPVSANASSSRRPVKKTATIPKMIVAK